MHRQHRFRAGGLLAMAGASLLIAACGGSSSSHHKSAASGSNSTTVSNAAATSNTVRTAHGALGTHLVGSSGHSLYLWLGDTKGRSNCAGACAKAWPPLTTTGKPTASGGATAADLGTVTRANGIKQVTYKGHPLYYFAGDSGAGQTNGQGSDAFGAKWWLVAPSGQAITKSSAGGSSSNSSGSAYG
jgi:predicted lipoprotein with Yx(FWY)xxD motif